MTAMLKQAAVMLAEEVVKQSLQKYTGGIIGDVANGLAFEKDCQAVRESTCVDPGKPDFSFGGGTFSFWFQCGSCEDPEQRGPACPVAVPFVDVALLCGPGGGGSATQAIGGGGGGGWGGWGGRGFSTGGACPWSQPGAARDRGVPVPRGTLGAGWLRPYGHGGFSAPGVPRSSALYAPAPGHHAWGSSFPCAVR